MNTWSSTALALACLSLAATAAEPPQWPAELVGDPVHVRNWNRFADGLLAMHRRLVAEHPTRKHERVGGYAGRPGFYRQEAYFHRPSGRLISKLQWETARPGNLHAIEVYRYDDAGRVTRDYAAAYLPDYRNAPMQTFLNLHAYGDGLHSFRQFDASGVRIFEHCEGTFDGEPVAIALPYEELAGVGEPSPVFGTAAYEACFAALPQDPGTHLQEIIAAPDDGGA